jgi:hypothetical protein
MCGFEFRRMPTNARDGPKCGSKTFSEFESQGLTFQFRIAGLVRVFNPAGRLTFSRRTGNPRDGRQLP